MTWTTKALERANEYVVIKHALRDMNGNLVGVKFRGGYAVVAKGGKAYLQLKMLPLVKGQPEFPLIFLRNLPFITRTGDVKIIYGQDVYTQYLAQLHVEIDKEVVVREEEAVVRHVEERNQCAYTTPKGVLCTHEIFKGSPGKYCKLHLLEDTQLESIGIVLPKRLTKEQKKEYKEKVISKLEKLTSE